MTTSGLRRSRDGSPSIYCPEEASEACETWQVFRAGHRQALAGADVEGNAFQRQELISSARRRKFPFANPWRLRSPRGIPGIGAHQIFFFDGRNRFQHFNFFVAQDSPSDLTGGSIASWRAPETGGSGPRRGSLQSIVKSAAALNSEISAMVICTLSI